MYYSKTSRLASSASSRKDLEIGGESTLTDCSPSFILHKHFQRLALGRWESPLEAIDANPNRGDGLISSRYIVCCAVRTDEVRLGCMFHSRGVVVTGELGLCDEQETIL